LSDIAVTPTASDFSSPVKISLTVTNTGAVRGAEVPQVYLGFPAESGEPPKRLVGFEKVWLEPGQSRELEIILDPAAANHPFGVFNVERGEWENLPGEYRVMVGTSAADSRHIQSIRFK